MASTPEGAVKRQVKKVLDSMGIWYFMPANNGYGKVGVPDFICCWDGQFMAIETKAPGKLNTLTPNQQRTIEEIRNAGGFVVVVDDAGQLLKEIAKWQTQSTKLKSSSNSLMNYASQ